MINAPDWGGGSKLYFIVRNLGVLFMEFHNEKTDTEVYETHLPFISKYNQQDALFSQSI
jgi:hypothetical protein